MGLGLASGGTPPAQEPVKKGQESLLSVFPALAEWPAWSKGSVPGRRNELTWPPVGKREEEEALLTESAGIGFKAQSLC